MSKNHIEYCPEMDDPCDAQSPDQESPSASSPLSNVPEEDLVAELYRRYSSVVVIMSQHNPESDTSRLESYFHGGRYAAIGMAEQISHCLKHQEDLP